MKSTLDIPKIIALSAAIGAAVLAVPAAQAVEIKAQVDWALAGVPGAASPDVDGPASSGFVDVLGGDSDGTGNSIFYHTYGNVDGNFGSRVSGDASFDITGKFTFKENYVATSTMPTFSFTVIPGEIRADQFYTDSGLPVPAGLDMFARYEIDIRVDGSSIWDSSAEVQVTATGATFTETGTDSIGGTPAVDPMDRFAAYFWGAFAGVAPLGSFSVGDTFMLEYDLITLAQGNGDTTGCMGGGGEPNGERAIALIDDGYWTMGPCGSAISRSGDPFSIGPNPPGNSISVSGAVPAAAPEPATLAILAAGLLGIGSVRRRARR